MTWSCGIVQGCHMLSYQREGRALLISAAIGIIFHNFGPCRDRRNLLLAALARELSQTRQDMAPKIENDQGSFQVWAALGKGSPLIRVGKRPESASVSQWPNTTDGELQ